MKNGIITTTEYIVISMKDGEIQYRPNRQGVIEGLIEQRQGLKPIEIEKGRRVSSYNVNEIRIEHSNDIIAFCLSHKDKIKLLGLYKKRIQEGKKRGSQHTKPLDHFIAIAQDNNIIS